MFSLSDAQIEGAGRQAAAGGVAMITKEWHHGIMAHEHGIRHPLAPRTYVRTYVIKNVRAT